MIFDGQSERETTTCSTLNRTPTVWARSVFVDPLPGAFRVELFPAARKGGHRVRGLFQAHAAHVLFRPRPFCRPAVWLDPPFRQCLESVVHPKFLGVELFQSGLNGAKQRL